MTTSCSAWLLSTSGAAGGALGGATGCPLAVADAACATSAACGSSGGCGARAAGSVVSAGCWAGSSTGSWAAAAGEASPPPRPLGTTAGGGGPLCGGAGCSGRATDVGGTARPLRSVLPAAGVDGSAALMRPCVCRATTASPHRAHARQGGAQGEVEADARGPRVRGSGRMRSSSGHMQRRVSCAAGPRCGGWVAATAPSADAARSSREFDRKASLKTLHFMKGYPS